ncbi:hypothetical protein AB1399_03665 [Hydrogenibacillus schlegelii]|uniref:Uncharacterized protein n=1 Tax=Hydrogenibacillus schlegelii TaxID=1484 RepID=A0A132NBK6_HYDSH|nr:hypothetical protein [Hydrogenibacillus schlegelii]KWX07337.1 hypothetical protein TR75_03290 [Hydrogenibacillus schlegelii]MBT9283553.1 hypothetical protein [Hydrogenibacillus schlegelii]OAR04963.1 hypothetical protein SA87_10220 [Hydrogenibacillus schlegelii]PTQ53803.1 MAG: hypothetical protein HSCHL_1431 [Hydrogenibacillus schlegelii]
MTEALWIGLAMAGWLVLLALIFGGLAVRAAGRDRALIIRLEAKDAAGELEHVVGSLVRSARRRGVAITLLARDGGSRDETPRMLETLERRYAGAVIRERAPRREDGVRREAGADRRADAEGRR